MKKKTRQQLEVEYKSLPFTNDFMFSEVMKDPELCKKLIQHLLGISIDHIEYVKTQKFFRHKKDAKGVRFDVYVKDSGKVFDVEMQVKKYSDLPLRARYYQCNIDLDCLKKKQEYTELPESFVMFICKTDPFGLDLPQYTVRNSIQEKKDSNAYSDKATKMFYNASAWESCENEEVRKFLKYVFEKKAESEFTRDIDTRVNNVRNNKTIMERFMTLRMKLNEEHSEGFEEAKAQLQPVIDSLKSEVSTLQN